MALGDDEAEILVVLQLVGGDEHRLVAASLRPRAGSPAARRLLAGGAGLPARLAAGALGAGGDGVRLLRRGADQHQAGGEHASDRSPENPLSPIKRQPSSR